MTHILSQPVTYKKIINFVANQRLLFGPGLVQKHYLASGVQQITTQKIDPCFFHGRTRQSDLPRGVQAIAAFRTCQGLSGIIHVDNESFVIHPLAELSSSSQTDNNNHNADNANSSPNPNQHSTSTGSITSHNQVCR